MNKVVAVGIVSIFLGAWIQAQEPDPNPDPLEEVTVRGKQPLGVLRAEVAKAETSLYESFNVAIAEPEFEIECRRYTPTGSRVGRRVCEPAYARMLRSQATWRALSLGGFATGDIDFASLRVTGNASLEISAADQKLLEKMVTAVTENAEVRDALARYLQAQQALAAASEPSEPDE